jgi:hypothetical protein
MRPLYPVHAGAASKQAREAMRAAGKKNMGASQDPGGAAKVLGLRRLRGSEVRVLLEHAYVQGRRVGRHHSPGSTDPCVHAPLHIVLRAARDNRDRRWYAWSAAAARHPQALLAFLQSRLVLEAGLPPEAAAAVRARYRE